MQGYHKNELFAEMETSSIKSKSWKNEFSKKTQITFYDSKKKKRKKEIRSFSQKNKIKKTLMKTKQAL